MGDYRPKGSHTWELLISYHRCPHCGTIIESRDAWQYYLGSYEKELDCPRCDHHFTAHSPQPKP